MKIKTIQLTNNPILDDLFIDFTVENYKAADTIILAGENGTGKSTLFNIIYEFSEQELNYGDDSASNEHRVFNIELSKSDIEILNSHQTLKEKLVASNFSGNDLCFEYDFNFTNDWNHIKTSFTNIDGEKIDIQSSLFYNDKISPLFKSIFSDVGINFNPNPISSVTSMDVDMMGKDSIKSNSNLATEITQLLIDVQALDDSDISNQAKNNPEEPVDFESLNLRMSRFEDAFNFMFINKKYKKVINSNDGKKVMFEEFGKEMSIDSLSSGEKQIVFRGGFLLRDQKNINTSFILIDEPEISLHPEWQLKILDFYKRLLTDDNGNQTSQLFVATHSPFIIHNNNRFNDKVIVLKKDSQGNTYIPDKREFYSWKSETQIKEAFNIESIVNKETPVVYVEGETDELYIKKAIEVLDIDLDIEIEWIGRKKDNGRVEFTGDTALNQVNSYYKSKPNRLKQKIILLYDSDTKKPEEDDGNLFIRCTPLNSENELFDIGIENLLTLPDDYPRDDFYEKINKEETDSYGAKTIVHREKLMKKKLCDWICNDLKLEKQKVYLKKFTKITSIINEILSS